MSLALVQRPDLPPDGNVDELKQLANTEHQLALEHAGLAVKHAIQAGLHLLMLKEKVPKGTWTQWLEDNFSGGMSTAYRYMQFANYRQLIEQHGIQTRDEAELFIEERIKPSRRDDRNGEQRRLARKLREEGKTYDEIAEVLGCSHGKVGYILYPERYVSYKRAGERRRRDAARALRKQWQEQSVRAVGGSVSKAYSQCRLLAQTLQSAYDSEQDYPAKAELRRALNSLYRVEDRIADASKTSRPATSDA